MFRESSRMSASEVFETTTSPSIGDFQSFRNKGRRQSAWACGNSYNAPKLCQTNRMSLTSLCKSCTVQIRVGDEKITVSCHKRPMSSEHSKCGLVSVGQKAQVSSAHSGKLAFLETSWARPDLWQNMLWCSQTISLLYKMHTCTQIACVHTIFSKEV